MAEKKKKTLKKIIFPIGIFLLLFLAESILGITGVVTYFYFSGKKNIREIETYTVNYSKTMAEAFAGVAELSYTSKKYSSLNSLFHEKIEANTIDEAFFVMDDGRLIVHSNTTTEKELSGNIAVDEMAYNLDMILRPVYTKSTELYINNYNIVDKKIPFNRRGRELLKKYFYKDIDSNGWLFTKGVFIKDKPAGAVNFIVTKDRIYNYIQSTITQARRCSLIVTAVSIILSFFISIIVLIRYRSIQRNALECTAVSETVHSEVDAGGELSSAAAIPESFDESDMEIDISTEEDFDIVLVEDAGSSPLPATSHAEEKSIPVIPFKKHEISSDDDEYITVELLGEIESEPEPVLHEPSLLKPGKYIAPVIRLDDYKNLMNKEIRDAIPVRKQR